MRFLTISCLVLLAGVTPAAADTRLICQNPGREYLVVYSQGAAALILNPDSESTKLKVLVDDLTDSSHVVTASTSSDEHIVRLHLRPYLKMEFWSEGQITQTDGCYIAR